MIHWALKQIQTLLFHRQNHVHQLMVAAGNGLFTYLGSSLVPILIHHNIDAIPLTLLLIGSSIFMMFAATFLSAFIVNRLKMVTLVFLLPGAPKTNQVYGRRNDLIRRFGVNRSEFPLDNLPPRVLFCICTLVMRVLAIIVDKYCIIPL